MEANKKQIKLIWNGGNSWNKRIVVISTNEVVFMIGMETIYMACKHDW